MGKSYPSIKKQSIFVCDHCHIKGHTIDKCYKLHGYPPSHPRYNSNRKIANTAQVQDSDTTLNVFNPSFTCEQYSYLMTLINKEKEQDQLKNSSLEESSNTALIAGNFCFLSKNLIDWVIDSGATNHICYGINFHI